MTYMPNTIFSCQTTSKKAKFLEFGVKSANLATLFTTSRCHGPLTVQSSVSPLKVLKQSANNFFTGDHGRPQKISRRGGKVDILLIFFWLLTMQRKLTYTKKKMSNVTATVAYSSFLVRKIYTEQMFVLVSMEIVRLS